MKKLTLAFLFLIIVPCMSAAPKIWLWSCETDKNTGETRNSFTLENPKLHFSWGPCGPTFTSSRWRYRVELWGDGPNYSIDKIRVRDALAEDINAANSAKGGYQMLIEPIVSGEVKIDAKKKRLIVNLKLKKNDIVSDLIANGSYKLIECADFTKSKDTPASNQPAATK